MPSKPMPAQLAAYIADTAAREKECQPYLDFIPELLCHESPKEILAFGREDSARGGYADYTVSAVISDGGRAEHRVAYVWEVKAPQLYAFEFDDNAGRVRPTKDLVRAESQLFHYVDEFSASPSFRQKYKLDAAAKVRAAGFIIGRSANMIKPNSNYPISSSDEVNLWDMARARREYFLYRAANIKLKNWDWVHEAILASATLP